MWCGALGRESTAQQSLANPNLLLFSCILVNEFRNYLTSRYLTEDNEGKLLPKTVMIIKAGNDGNKSSTDVMDPEHGFKANRIQFANQLFPRG
jgi:hypothetical protein